MHDNSHRTSDEFSDDINLEDEDEMAEWCRLFECSAVGAARGDQGQGSPAAALHASAGELIRVNAGVPQ